MTLAQLPENYRWWQEHGSIWPDEIQQRKAYMPIYHIQEIFLAEYFSRQAPAKILEFGCGFGRQLCYLSRIPGLEVYGCDQSQTMIDGIRAWASNEWMDERIKLVEPLAPLPYPDKSFDIVFTVSVLIHIRPEHIQFFLGELARIARWQIIHIENNNTPETIKTADAHDGCWAHPLTQHYRVLGQRAEVLEKPFEIEDIYRVVLDETRSSADLNPVTIGRLLMLDRAVSECLNQFQGSDHEHTRQRQELQSQILITQGERDWYAEKLREAQTEQERLRQQIEQLQVDHSQVQARDEQLKLLWTENARLITAARASAEQAAVLAAQIEEILARSQALEAQLSQQQAEHTEVLRRQAQEMLERQQDHQTIDQLVVRCSQLEGLIEEYQRQLSQHAAFTTQLGSLLKA